MSPDRADLLAELTLRLERAERRREDLDAVIGQVARERSALDREIEEVRRRVEDLRR